MPLSNGILAFEFVLNSANDNHGVKVLFFLARKDNYRIWTELSGISTLSNEFTGNKGLRTQCAEKILNKIAEAINEIFAALECMPQGFRIYFV